MKKSANGNVFGQYIEIDGLVINLPVGYVCSTDSESMDGRLFVAMVPLDGNDSAFKPMFFTESKKYFFMRHMPDFMIHHDYMKFLQVGDCVQLIGFNFSVFEVTGSGIKLFIQRDYPKDGFHGAFMGAICTSDRGLYYFQFETDFEGSDYSEAEAEAIRVFRGIELFDTQAILH